MLKMLSCKYDIVTAIQFYYCRVSMVTKPNLLDNKVFILIQIMNINIVAQSVHPLVAVSVMFLPSSQYSILVPAVVSFTHTQFNQEETFVEFVLFVHASPK